MLPRALEEFLLDPDRDYKWIRMGDLGLKAAEARALVAFLLSRPGDPLKTQILKRPPHPARGRELVEKLREAVGPDPREEKKSGSDPSLDTMVLTDIPLDEGVQ